MLWVALSHSYRLYLYALFQRGAR